MKSKEKSKVRKTLSKIVSGKCITEEKVINRMKSHAKEQSLKGKKVQQDSQLPSCSGYKPKKEGSKKTQVVEVSSEDEDDSDDELCCVCNAFDPWEVRNSVSEIITKWAKCDGIKDGVSCDHWTHLGFCCKTKVIRRNVKFLCPHCEESDK